MHDQTACCYSCFYCFWLFDFLSSRQDLSENTRLFAARLKGKDTTCSYSCICPKDGCNQEVDFTDIVVKDVLVTGIANNDICKELLGWESLDENDINEPLVLLRQKRWHVMP